MKENLNLSDKKMVMTIAAFAVIVAVMVLIGVCVLPCTCCGNVSACDS